MVEHNFIKNKLKRSVIKEELVAITGNFVEAVILNQLIYWSERVSDFDKFIAQEKTIAERHGEQITIEQTHGWIYKSAEELSEETLLKISKQNMRLHIKKLIELGYIQERNNPKYKWDKTKQYRLNMVKIQKDLQNLGYCLEGYPLILNSDMEIPKTTHRGNNLKHQANDLEPQSEQIVTAIPEITTEITSEIINNNIIYEKNHPNDFRQGGNSYSMESEGTNALSTNNLNALSSNNKNALNFVNNKNINENINEHFEKLWKMLPSTKYDRKSQVKPKRKKELYKIEPERVEKAINLYLKIQDPKYYYRRDNFFNEIIDNYLDKNETDFRETFFNENIDNYLNQNEEPENWWDKTT